MDKKDSEFLKKLLTTFKIEAQEHIKKIVSLLIELEKPLTAEKQKEILEIVFRETHSLKGASRTVNLTNVEKICQTLENFFASLKNNEIKLLPAMFDVLHYAINTLEKLISIPDDELTPEHKKLIAELIKKIERLKEAGSELKKDKDLQDEEAINIVSSEIKEKSAGLETVRIDITKLDKLLFKTEDMLSVKLITNQRAEELKKITEDFILWKKEITKINPTIQAVHQFIKTKNKNGENKNNEHLKKLINFVETNKDFFKLLEKKFNQQKNFINSDRHLISGMIDNLLEEIKRTVMLPFSLALEVFPKFVRDIAKVQDKQVELIVQGGEIEVDRRIIEEMKDPLVHIIRNCIDHGIEKPAERIKKNKPPTGKIAVAVSQLENKKLQIIISDDGAGINLEKLKTVVVANGIIPADEINEINAEELQLLIFRSGVSTSAIITDISGRGLGLAIVQEKVQKLRGTISYESEFNLGTTFKIILPLSLATFRGILIKVNESLFAVPTVNVKQVLRVKRSEIKTIENKETILFTEKTIPVIPLSAVLELPLKENKNEKRNFTQMMVVDVLNNCIAFSVDEIISEQEVLVKNLSKQLSRVRNILGTAFLGTGQIIPILNVLDLIKSAVNISSALSKKIALVEDIAGEKKNILVVEDSITSRTFLKNVLETAGYNVKTAVDGLEAFTLLKMEKFDLVVSDVEMPRMDGFELTAKIRGEKKYLDLPVILVTALESQKDKERGIDVGADAYIVKSSFEQSNLLEVIKRLV